MSVTYHRAAGVRRQVLTGHWHPSLLQNAHNVAQQSSSAAAWNDYIDIVRNLQGVSFDQWQHVSEYYLASRFKSASLFLRLMNHVLTPGMLHKIDEQKRWSAYESLVTQAPRWSAGTIRDVAGSGFLGTCVSHYPGLLVQPDDIPQKLSRTHFGIQRQIKNAEALVAARTPFAYAIDNLITICPLKSSSTTSVRISVVGNSPALLNETSGHEIDSADLVVRFNNVSDLKRQRAHTGTRTDIWVMSPSTPVTLCPEDAKLVIVSSLHALDRASFYWRHLPSLERELTQFPAGIWYELVRCFQAPPSAGTLLLASLESLCQDIAIKTYGFTTCDSQLSQVPNHHADHKPRSSRHNWVAETQWLGNRG